jgi:hypothetical protein
MTPEGKIGPMPPADRWEIWGVKVRMTDSASANAAVEWLRSEGHQASRQWGRARVVVAARDQDDADAVASKIQERWPEARVEVRGD